ncbi:hypothetical protein N658DRAFT_202611 [Parathielavia hyrcaniae]|uniref:Uncharacterized protein n=1 Tax=Parathielavia hyrcaniae TaxID=113614 RepID=A0AAN6PVZ3_9PEZI|nr:hypothetical protein N658DRAFT_202611 [Parathielavia hyrcaniae]
MNRISRPDGLTVEAYLHYLHLLHCRLTTWKLHCSSVAGQFPSTWNLLAKSRTTSNVCVPSRFSDLIVSSVVLETTGVFGVWQVHAKKTVGGRGRTVTFFLTLAHPKFRFPPETPRLPFIYLPDFPLPARAVCSSPYLPLPYYNHIILGVATAGHETDLRFLYASFPQAPIS